MVRGKYICAGEKPPLLPYETAFSSSSGVARVTSAMKIDIRFFAAPGLLLLAGLGTPAAAQRPRNDGFCRRDGQMHVLRNGQLRPLLRDARLPTGTIVTPDGFLIAKNGERTALSEGQGCDLQGHIMTVESALGGSLALGKTAAPPVAAAPPVSVPASAAEEEAAGQNARFGQQQNAAAAARDQSNQPDQPANTGDEKKREEQAREQRKRDEERQREEVKRGEENEREARKEEKEMRKKDRKGDD